MSSQSARICVAKLTRDDRRRQPQDAGTGVTAYASAARREAIPLTLADSVLMPTPTVIARYLIETPLPVEQAAEMIAGEQSSGTFLPVPGETEELKARARARVTDITLLDTVDPLAARRTGAKDAANPLTYQRAEITHRVSLRQCRCESADVGLDTSAATSTNCRTTPGASCWTSNCRMSSPTRYPGPQFGVEGTRRLTGVERGPSSARSSSRVSGCRQSRRRQLVRELGEAGIDFVKDDELMADPPHSPLKERVECVCVRSTSLPTGPAAR